MKDFFDPAGWLWLFLVGLALWLYGKGHHRRLAMGIGLFAVGWSALEWWQVPARLLALREAPFLGRSVDDFDSDVLRGEIDAVVMLGGVLMPSPEFSGANYLDSVDRFITAVTVAQRTGKPLVLGGGIAGRAGSDREPDYEKRWLEDWKMKEVTVMDLGEVQNTHDEIVAASALAKNHGWKRVVLVTSAWHLTRAVAVCDQEGLQIMAVACDFRGTSERNHGRRRLIPSSESGVFIKRWLTEWVGQIYYRWRGWG